MSSTGCPHCGHDAVDGAWFTFVDVSVCMKLDYSGARLETRISCNECHGYIDVPGADFPGHFAEGSYVGMPADKMLDLDKMLDADRLVVDRVLDADKIKISMGCTTIKNDCSLCENKNGDDFSHVGQ